MDNKYIFLYCTYFLLLAPFWFVIGLRVLLPENNLFTLFAVTLFLFFEYFLYPFATGLAIKIYHDDLMGIKTTLSDVITHVRHRYSKLMGVFSSLFITYFLVAIVLLVIVGNSWAVRYDNMERGLDKLTFIWEGSLLIAALNLFINIIHPVWIPVGIATIVSPSSGFILAATSVSLISIAVMFYFTIRLGLWFPFITLNNDKRTHSIGYAWGIGGRRVGELFRIFFKSIGKLLLIYLIIGIASFVIFNLALAMVLPEGLLLAPLAGLGIGGELKYGVFPLFERPFSIGYFLVIIPYFIILPTIVSLYFQKLRTRVYLKAVKDIS